MKKLLFLIIIGITFIINSYSQHYFYSEQLNTCSWNTKTKKFDICTASAESALFKINKEKTIITLNCESGKYSYFINTTESNEERQSIMYGTTCSDGNEFVINIDLLNNEIHILQGKTEYITPVKAYFIQKMWSEE